MVGDDGLGDARTWVAAARQIVALTGAGISTDSGIPDFRGPQGVWTRNPGAERTATIQIYLADPEVRQRVWRSRLESPAWDARPNAGHLALVDLERQGRLLALVTQNIDELHQIAGNDPGRIVELHGTMRSVKCLSCGERGPMAPVLDRVRAGEDDPACTTCGGILKAATISFGQSLVREVLDAAVAAARDCDLLVTAGTSLQVHPAASLCDIAQGSGARLVVLNAEPTPYDAQADAVLREPLGRLLPELLAVTP